jgi:acyl-CoA synthetase (NDP forming)/RimJ/RimL family protein N-acetyltransferase
MTVPRFNPAGRFDPAALFRPKSVAVLGADSQAGAHFVANLSLGGFKGTIQTRLADNTSLAVLAVAPERIGPEMTALAEANCFAAIVPGPADDLAAHSVRTGVRVLGAHSFGLAVPGLGLNATLSHMTPPPGRLAMISQSAALCRTVIDWAPPNGVGFSHIVGIGSNAGIGFSLALDWLSRDPGTGAILLDIRRIKNHRLFLSAARAAARLRPVVAIRAGLRLLNGDGGADLSFEAALRRAGVLYVKSFEDLLAAVQTLSRAKAARWDTLAIVSNAIGPGRLAADCALREGLQLRAEDGFLQVASAELAATAFGLAAEPDIGGVLVVHAPQGQADNAAIAGLCQPPVGLRAPLLVCAMGETTGAMHRTALAAAGMAVFPTPDQAVQGFGYLVRDRRNREAARELPASTVLDVAPKQAWVRQCFDRIRGAGSLTLTQDEALGVLAAYGIPIVPTRFVSQADDAAAAAALVGFPAVVKLRDRPPASSDAVAQTLVRISQLIVDFPEIAVLEVPSLFVDADGVLAADAWLRLRGADEPAFGLAIAPYPAELIEHCQIGPDRMTIRPIRPEDAVAHTAFFARISPEDIRYRFFSAIRELSAEQTARLTQVDYDREIAFIAVNETNGDTVGVARLAGEQDGRSGEFAVIVQADMKGRGLASLLMRRLISWARGHGLEEIVGQILADNQPMLAFIRHLGFTVHRMADDASVMEAKLRL